MSKDFSISELPLLAVAMIVRNAENQIVATLDSVRSIADMIVVVDTGSTDATTEVARRYTNHVTSIAWQDNFSRARNDCLAHVRTQWVLWLDAGETLDSMDVLALRQFIETKGELSKAYMMLVRVAKAAGAIASEQLGCIRLVPNRPGIQFSGRVRESLAASLVNEGISVDALPWPILRGSENNKNIVKVARARRDMKLADLEINHHGNQSRYLTCLGEALQTLDQPESAADYFRHSIQNAAQGATEMLEGYYGLLTALDSQGKSSEAQLAVCLEALEYFPFDIQLLCAMGGYVQMQGRFDLAVRAYETAYRHGKINPEIWHLQDVREIAGVCWSRTLYAQSDPDNALTVLEEAVEENPNSIRLRQAIIDLHVKRGRRDEALRHVRLLPDGFPHLKSYLTAVEGACLAIMKDWVAARELLKQSYESGCRESLCLRWLVSSLLVSQDLGCAKQIILEWKQLEPTSLEVKKFAEWMENYPEANFVEENLMVTVVDSIAETARQESPLGSIPTPPERRNSKVRIDVDEQQQSTAKVSCFPSTSKTSQSQ